MIKFNLFLALLMTVCFCWPAEAIAEFDKKLAWGKRDYSCLIFDTPKIGSKLRVGEKIELKWAIGECGASGDKIGDFDLRLYNSLEYGFASGAPLIKSAYSTKIVDHIPSTTFTYTWRVPDIKEKGVNPNLYYIRVTTSSKSNPQQPTLFAISGPFTILPKF
ncbi:hypothetical protein K7432_017404 [Basidiobolus ranarum]|uniref:Uncharacterized protein n=1 Tax=Basidiobolus ranarum TaxID=34480 RepID=A0ABR2VLH8_9FUNG